MKYLNYLRGNYYTEQSECARNEKGKNRNDKGMYFHVGNMVTVDVFNVHFFLFINLEWLLAIKLLLPVCACLCVASVCVRLRTGRPTYTHANRKTPKPCER